MSDFRKALWKVVGLWNVIVLFLTFPLWVIPFYIYEFIQAYRSDDNDR